MCFTKLERKHQDFEAALSAVRSGKSITAAVKGRSISRTTFYRYCQGVSTKNIGRPPIFNATQEKEFVHFVHRFSTTAETLSNLSIRKLAFDFAELMGINHKFNRCRQVAGKHWLEGFLKRNPNLKKQATHRSTTINAKQNENANRSTASHFVSPSSDCGALDLSLKTNRTPMSWLRNGFPETPKQSNGKRLVPVKLIGGGSRTKKIKTSHQKQSSLQKPKSMRRGRSASRKK